MKHAFAFLLCALALAAHPSLARAGDLRMAEEEIKVGLIYNFLKYSAWPGAPTGQIVVCLYDHDPFGALMAPMAGRTVNGRLIGVKVVADIANVNSCSLLFISANQRRDWPTLRRALDNKPILTVGEFDGFAAGGGMIEFTRSAYRIGLKANQDAIRGAGLVVQERLLQLASDD